MGDPVKLMGTDYNSDVHTTNAGGSTYAYFLKYLCGSNGTITSMKFHAGGQVAYWKIKIALYNDNAGNPGTVVAQTVAIDVTPNVLNTVPFPETPIVSGQYYWIAFYRSYDNSIRRGYTLPYDIEWVYDAGLNFTDFVFPDSPTPWKEKNNFRQYAFAAYGSLATGGAGRLIGSGDPSMIHVGHPKMIHVANPSLIRARGG